MVKTLYLGRQLLPEAVAFLVPWLKSQLLSKNLPLDYKGEESLCLRQHKVCNPMGFEALKCIHHCSKTRQSIGIRVASVIGPLNSAINQN